MKKGHFITDILSLIENEYFLEEEVKILLTSDENMAKLKYF